METSAAVLQLRDGRSQRFRSFGQRTLGRNRVVAGSILSVSSASRHHIMLDRIDRAWMQSAQVQVDLVAAVLSLPPLRFIPRHEGNQTVQGVTGKHRDLVTKPLELALVKHPGCAACSIHRASFHMA
ncbi:hypothetical protein Ae201684_006010 [Aphanomyces euteiches]|uniref:Uncharacterized protein n=1 Tax=Aphanomyces euteiches TaxID=100861 RepID=A0A6G0XD91_9STRA|nr:hypothetical protein Ae201684_006010 [Aphanomyces euteiches]